MLRSPITLPSYAQLQNYQDKDNPEMRIYTVFGDFEAIRAFPALRAHVLISPDLDCHDPAIVRHEYHPHWQPHKCTSVDAQLESCPGGLQ